MSGFWELLLGLVSGAAQGVFEWLPVSSKTVLLLIFYWSGVPAEKAYLLGLFLNGSTALAASIYFRRSLWEALQGFVKPGEGRRLLGFLLASTLVTAAVAVPLASLSEEFLTVMGRASMIAVACLFAGMTIILWLREGIRRTGSKRPLSILDALLAGLAQGFSALPGVSRSGITIFALLGLGYPPREALELSFLMSIPATIGGSAFTYLAYRGTIQALPAPLLIAAAAAALAVSIPAIDSLLKLSQKTKPYIFTLILALIALLAALTQI